MKRVYQILIGSAMIFSLMPTTNAQETTGEQPTPTALPKESVQLYEQQLREKTDAAEKVLFEKLEKLRETANTTNSSDPRNVRGFVLSTEVQTFKDIPGYVDSEIAAIRESIRVLIFQVATDIENSGGATSRKITINNQGIDFEPPPDAFEPSQKLMEAKRKNNVSVRSIQLAIQLLSSVNTKLIEHAREAKGELKKRWYITQASYIYEMADIVLTVLKDVSLEGKPVIEQIRQEHQGRLQKRITEIQREIERIKREQQNKRISEDEATNLQYSYSLMIRANKKSVQAWGDLMAKVNSQETWINDIKKRALSVELVRNAAKHQLETLRDITVISEMTDLFTSIDDLVAAIKDIKLLDLTDEEVSEMLFPRSRIDPEKL